MYFTTLFYLLCTLRRPQTSHQSLPWIWGWEFRAGQWCTENHRCFQISFQGVCSREIIMAVLLTGVPTALQPGLFIEPKGSFNLRSIRLRPNKYPPKAQQGSAPRLELCRKMLLSSADPFFLLCKVKVNICKPFRDAAVSFKNNLKKQRRFAEPARENSSLLHSCLGPLPVALLLL